MIEATVVFMVRGGAVLLGEKQKKYCAGCLVPPGGRVEIGESMQASAIRETQEECGLTPVLGRQPLGSILCYHEGSLNDILVHIFRTTRFHGTPTDTDELQSVGWYSLNDETIGRMMMGDRSWINHVIHPRRFEAHIWYAPDGKHLTKTPIVRLLE